MSAVKLIGLGAMGSALAKALIDAGRSITVWNRSPERLEKIVALGAQGASDVPDAVKSSNVILVCVSNYTATRNFLGTEEVIPTFVEKRWSKWEAERPARLGTMKPG